MCRQRGASPNVIIERLTVRNSGRSLELMDAGIFLEKTATNAVVRNNLLRDNLVRVYVHGAARALVEGNDISGWVAPNRNDSGNGVYVTGLKLHGALSNRQLVSPRQRATAGAPEWQIEGRSECVAREITNSMSAGHLI